MFTSLSLAALSSCSSMYYAAMEQVGVHKREILVDRVLEAREEQAEAKEQFQTTFETFKSLTGFDGGELEDTYERLNKDFEKADDAADEVRDRIDSIENVSAAMFKEWSGEIEEMDNASLRSKSSALLTDTQQRYDQMIAAMRKAETRMEPVLVAFRDHVLFLKHNLNARAIASLQDSVVEIESDISVLIQDMQDSIDEADSFIASMGEGEAG